jgi:hypothetical protein
MSQAYGVLRNVRINLRVRPFQINIGDDRWATVSRAGEVDDIRPGVLNRAIQVRENWEQG